MGAKSIVVKVEWFSEDEVYVATSDNFIGLVVQEDNLDDCCETAKLFVLDMLEEQGFEDKDKIIIDFDIIN